MNVNRRVITSLVSVFALSIGATGYAMQDEIDLVPDTKVKQRVSKKVLLQSKTLANLLQDNPDAREIPVPNISHVILPSIVHLMQEQDRLGVNNFLLRVAGMVKDLTNEQLVNAFNAANFLELPVVLQGLAMVIINRIPKNKLPQMANDIAIAGSKRKEEERKAAISRLKAGLSFLKGISDPNQFMYLSQALSPAGVLIVNKTGYPLKVNAGTGEKTIAPEGQSLVKVSPNGIALNSVTSLETIDPQSKKAVSGKLEISGENLIQEFIKLNKQPLQRTLVMTVTPDKGVTGVKGWFVNRVTWSAAAYGATMEKEETVTFSENK